MYWDASLSVHNEELDAQHKSWLDILNKLHDAMLNDAPEALVQSKLDALRAMIDYTQEHFSAEETYMRQAGFPHIEAHMGLHRSFVDQINGFYEDLQAGKAVLGTQVIKVMQDWLKVHIATEDSKYADYQR
jgi:hemerythrin